jgi:site-specific DNA recombinase
MGGPLPLGYDVRDRLLVVNETEAKLVRRIFDDFVTVRSATLMAKAYGAEGVVTKGGKPFTKQTIYKMLHNRMYLGEIVHKGQSFPASIRPSSRRRSGMRARTDRHRWHRAAARNQRPPERTGAAAWPAVHVRWRTAGAQLHRQERQDLPLLQPDQTPALWRMGQSARAVASGAIEELVTQQIVAALSAPHIVQSVWDRMQHIRPDLTEPQVVLPMRNLASLWRELFPASSADWRNC